MIKRSAALLAVIACVMAVVPLMAPPRPVGAAPLLGGRVHSRFNPSQGKIFVLIIGNDARSGNPDESRADAIHIAGIDTKTMKGGILNFPRDSWVSVPGVGSSKMNEALYHGGPKLLAQTLENVTGIRIDYWIMTGFEGFSDLIDEIGGVRMHIAQDVNDPTGSGAHIKAGDRVLGRFGALAYARTRHSFPNGDIDRTTHQGDMLLALLAKLRRQAQRDPGAVLDWLRITSTHTRLDIPAPELFRLAVLVSAMDPKDVRSVTVPVRIGAVGAASVVFIEDEANGIFARFKRTGRL
ncbi:MAG TPA: LCP family protein [Actinomycetota bacterium]|nr:LCP family protein [Actinomycetota bacterium]